MAELMYSIIIPVYNAQEYLEECLQSVIKQANERVEVICINDGSKDKSKEILDQYKNEYSFIQVYHKKNEGVSIARNEGLKMAKGKYILFLDSDDILIEHSLEMLDKVLENHDYDMVVGRTRESFTKHATQTIHNLEQLTNNLDLAEFRTKFISAKDNLGIWAVWRHIFKRSFLKENEIFFNSAYSFAEDMDFIIRALLTLKSYTFIDFPFIRYRVYENSVSGQYTLKSALSHLFVLSYWREYFAENKAVCTYFANKQIAMLPHVSHLSSEDKETYFKEYQEHSNGLHKASGKFALVYLASRLVGFRKMSEWLGR